MGAWNRCHWLIDLNRCLRQWSNPIGECINGHCTTSLWTLMWPNSASELIYTRSINNNIHGIICSAELKTPIVSPMDCVYSHGASHRKYAASSCCCCFRSDRENLFIRPPSPPRPPASTLFTVWPLVASVAHTVARHAQSVPTALRIDTLRGGNVALSALPAAVALTAPPGVLAVTAAQDWTGG